MKKVLTETQARIEKVTKRLERQLGLDGWLRITHHFVEGYDGDTQLDGEGKVSIYKTCAVTTTQWEYRVAKITWYLSTAAAQTDAELEEIAIHEYVHVLIAPIANLVPSKSHNAALEEFAVESMMRAIGHAMGRENVN